MNTFINMFQNENKSFSEINKIYLDLVNKNCCTDVHEQLNDDFIEFKQWFDLVSDDLNPTKELFTIEKQMRIRMIKHFGLAQKAKEKGLKYNTFYTRFVTEGWDLHTALNKPLRKQSQRKAK